MAKKKKKKVAADGFTDSLVKLIAAGDPKDAAAAAQAAGLSNEVFEAAFAEAVQMATKGPDPRRLTALPEQFQVAFLRMAEQDEDDDLIGDLLSMSDNKQVKKEAKRILHKLRSRGLSVDIPDEAGPSILDRVIDTADKVLPCYLSSPNGNGSRMVLMARYAQGGVAVHQGELSDEDGLVQFAGGTIGRNRYRQMVQGMTADEDEQLLEITFAEARWHLAQAADLSRKAGKTLPDDYLQASADLGEVDDQAAPQPAAQLFPADAVAASDLLSRGPELLDLAEFADWLPDEDTIKSVDEKIKEVEQSQVAINDQQRIEQVQKAIDRAAGIMLGDAERRQRYHQRLLEVAAYLMRTERPELARVAAASAWQLLAEGFEPEESKLFDALIKKLFRSAEEIVAHLAANPSPPSDSEDDQAGDASKLIVTP